MQSHEIKWNRVECTWFQPFWGCLISAVFFFFFFGSMFCRLKILSYPSGRVVVKRLRSSPVRITSGKKERKKKVACEAEIESKKGQTGWDKWVGGDSEERKARVPNTAVVPDNHPGWLIFQQQSESVSSIQSTQNLQKASQKRQLTAH
jgi:hypothetical protein